MWPSHLPPCASLSSSVKWGDDGAPPNMRLGEQGAYVKPWSSARPHRCDESRTVGLMLITCLTPGGFL